MNGRDPRLGRGLAALMGDAQVPRAPEDGVRSMPVSVLEPGPFQPRTTFDEAALEELAASIRANGVLQPLLARVHPAPRHTGAGQRYQIVAGERRWRAAQLAGLHEVPVLVRHMTDHAVMTASLVENLQRQDLDPIEEAEGFARLLEEHGMTQESLATAVGKSRSHIANTTRLLALPAAVRAHVQGGRLSAGHARALLAHPDPSMAADMVIARGLNVRQTEALASQKPAPAKAAPSRDPETAALERDVSERLGLKVQISFDGRGGAVTVRYASLDQLDSLLALLNR